MALFMNTNSREPLVERHTRDAIARRSAEIVGFVILAFATIVMLVLGSYTPDDPGIFHATDRAPENLLGLPGAVAADLLHRAIGWAGWTVPVILAVWGLRFIFHVGESRVMPRILAAPFVITVAAVLLAGHTVPDGWNHDYGLGGMLGDAVFGGLFSILPASITGSVSGVAWAVKAMSLFLMGATLYVGAVALGLTWAELANFFRFCMRSCMALAFLALGALTLVWKRLLALFGRKGEAVAARQNAPVVSTGPSPMADKEDAIMARITAAIAARNQPEREENPVFSEPEIEDDTLLDLPRETVPETPVHKVATTKRTAKKSARAQAEEQPRLKLGDAEGEAYQRPPLALLSDPANVTRHVPSTEALSENARLLENVLDDYGVKGEILSVRPGPVVTMYELEPAPGLKASRVIGLADDIARSMSALAARVSTIPGRSVIGIELPNAHREMVLLRELLSTADYGDSKHRLPLALGKDISGEPVVANLARMPHLLIAGTTGSGKSVAINTMILSLLYRLSPDDCRVIMIDPKMLELSVYDGIPHLLSPVVTDPKKAVVALKWVVAEMEERYRKMSKMGVRNIDGYNARVADALGKGEAFSRTVQTGFDDETGEPIFETEEFQPEKMPFIVVIVDEMADLMMVAGKEIEACIQRLAQMARASGIHLIMATQRPSVDVITGTIKANFPTRISFQVTSKVDSRTILGEMGAEQLLGQGDMLYMAGGGRITRVHGPFVSDEEVEEIVTHLKSFGVPEYVAGVVDGPDDGQASDIDMVLGLGGNTGSEDALYDQAVAIVARDRKCSTSYIQRKLAIGYNKAARLVEQMEDNGVVSSANQVGKREVLVPER